MRRTRARPEAAHPTYADDPLTRALLPPPNETDAQRHLRIRDEEEAAHMSAIIDDELARQRAAERKSGRPIKLLLLGQSESGKSTTLKNFQLKNSPRDAFKAERATWRAIIQLNVVRSVRLVLDALAQPAAAPHLAPAHAQLRAALTPLLLVEQALARRLTARTEPQILGATALAQLDTNANIVRAPKEVSVNSASAWRVAFARRGSGESFGSSKSAGGGREEDREGFEAGRVLHASAQDIRRLYRDPVVRKVLMDNQVRLEEMSGFFLDDIERVTDLRYIPTDDDVLRARIKTLGVSEYRFALDSSSTVSRDWRIYDVGGHRSLRAAWVPFFDDMNAIIFLAPMSAFDQVLEEDTSVNRIEDSVLLWKSICSNRLLEKTNLILFLNKSDILRRKLESGVRFSDFVVSYGGRPNDFDSVSKYLKRKFASLQKEHSPAPRPFYCHLTSVTDTKSTFVILEHVQDTVIRGNLKRSHLVD